MDPREKSKDWMEWDLPIFICFIGGRKTGRIYL